MKNTELSLSGHQKREAWATRGGAESYIAEMGSYALERDKKIIIRMLGRGPGLLLDFPCGTGRHIETCKKLGFKITAADYSPKMLNIAKQHHNVNFVRGDVFNPPFPPSSFDAIIISRLLFHYAKPEKILKAMLPCLKPNGRIIFDTLNRYSLRWLASQIFFPIYNKPARKLYFEQPSKFEKKVSDLGLQVIGCESAYLLPTRVYRYLPNSVIKIIDAIESFIPQSFRVLSYWRACKKDLAC